MKFPIKRKKTNYSEREEEELFRMYQGRPPLKEYPRISTRRTFRIAEKLHTKGEVVDYHGEPHIITKVTKKGIYVNEFTEKEDDLTALKRKGEFISEKRIREGEVYPHTSLFFV
jgi:hypothetical protein